MDWDILYMQFQSTLDSFNEKKLLAMVSVTKFFCNRTFNCCCPVVECMVAQLFAIGDNWPKKFQLPDRDILG